MYITHSQTYSDDEPCYIMRTQLIMFRCTGVWCTDCNKPIYGNILFIWIRWRGILSLKNNTLRALCVRSIGKRYVRTREIQKNPGYNSLYAETLRRLKSGYYVIMIFFLVNTKNNYSNPSWLKNTLCCIFFIRDFMVSTLILRSSSMYRYSGKQ